MPSTRLVTVLSTGGLAAALAVTIAVTGTVGGQGGRSSGGSRPSVTPTGSLGRIAPVALHTFSGCDSLQQYYRSNAARLVTPYGLPGQEFYLTPGVYARSGAMAPLAAGAAGGSAAAAAGSSGSAGSGGSADGTTGTGTDPGSGTNVQVAGVDEADIAKLSGNLLLALTPGTGGYPAVMAGGAAVEGTATGTAGGGFAPSQPTAAGLRVLRMDAGHATVIGRLATPDWTPQQLLADGSTALLLGPVPQPVPVPRPGTASPDTRSELMPALAYYPSRTRIAQVDLTDPGQPRLVRTLDVDGAQVGARLVGGVARIAVSSIPQPPIMVPRAGTATAQQQALQANRARMLGSTLDTWLPSYTLTESGGQHSTGRLVDCARVAAPAEFAGLDTLTLLSVDLRAGTGIARWQAAGVVASGATLYATADHVYVATARWQNWAALNATDASQATLGQRTSIYEFETAGAAAPRYLAGGSAPGFLLNQYALDEYQGALRVASTTQPVWLPQPMATPPRVGADIPSSRPASVRVRPSTSQVTVLRRSGDSLQQVGQLSGLGAGEQIRGVRFLGPVGYLVTYRQTDPLFTLDLSDPARPRQVGELKLLGYSAYLHPVGNGLLLGIGQDADGDGRVRGLQLSLFDVSDPARPRRISQVRLPQAWASVESDQHAFAFTDGLVLAPFTQWSYAGTGAGVVAVRLTGNSLGNPAVLHTYPGSQPVSGQAAVGSAEAVPLRSFVAGGDIWTVATTGVAVHDQASLGYLAFTGF